MATIIVGDKEDADIMEKVAAAMPGAEIIFPLARLTDRMLEGGVEEVVVCPSLDKRRGGAARKIKNEWPQLTVVQLV